MKKILITGAAGFIGFNLCKLLISKNYMVYGIDNFDNYYSISLKKKRIKILKENKNFFFKKIDITNKKNLIDFFKNKNFNFVIHLAAQAGVRYSLLNPQKYIDVNIFGFLNIIDLSKKNNVKKFIYASSSSVYGESKKFPLKENQQLNPKNIYGLTKKLNEQIAKIYYDQFNLRSIGLRFFTIYGEWGRPDMFLLKLFNASFNKKKFYLNNYGKHKRDFTYISDATNAVYELINKNNIKHDVINICSNKPINILDIINYFKKNNYINFKLVGIHKADVKDTHGSNLKLKKIIKKFKISNFYECFDKTYKWYFKNNIHKLKK
jgi:UDP-glucuronate 4-epimerase